MSKLSPARMPGRIAMGLFASLLVAGSGASEPAKVWREAFQSSPAIYAPFPEPFIQAVAKQMKVDPALMRERMSPKPLSGTMRYRILLTGEGSEVRIRLSNEEGSTPLRVSAASVALAAERFQPTKGSLKPLLFGGSAAVTIAPGAPAISDPVDLPIKFGTELIVSVAVATPVLNDPRAGFGLAVAAGDQTRNESLEEPRTIMGRPLVTGASVLTSRPQRVIVAMGDSITDGARATPGALRGWPEVLSRRLATNAPGAYNVLNAGIGGNRLLASGWGAAGLARLDRDVLRIEGVSHLILFEGTNDIGMSGKSYFDDAPLVTPEALIAGYQQVIARAHARGVKVIIGTLTPTGGSLSHSSPEKDRVREAVNQWIRTSGEPDGLIDFDVATRDPADPGRFRKSFDSGDHLHPSDEGYRAMGAAIDLSLFR